MSFMLDTSYLRSTPLLFLMLSDPDESPIIRGIDGAIQVLSGRAREGQVEKTLVSVDMGRTTTLSMGGHVCMGSEDTTNETHHG